VCATCHPSGPPAYTCTKCHNQAQMDSKHAQVKGYNPGACASCHKNGGGG
jgi:predicted CXXCH cytochrome family protein